MADELEPAATDWGQQHDKPPLVAQPAVAVPSDPPGTRSLSLAFLAAAVAALLGGLAWAAISAATGYNLGILAFLIGAATGLTAQWVASGPIGGFERGLAGLFAAVAVVIGDYVLFV